MWSKKYNRNDELAEFISFFISYLSQRIGNFGNWFESIKNFVVMLLLTKRGKYSQSFLNTSFLILIAAVIIVWPAIAANNPFIEDDSKQDQIYTSQIITTNYEDYDAITTISDKPRDRVVEYTVKNGDTLKSISEFFDVSVESIQWLNNLNGVKINPNQKIKVPPVSGVVHKVKTGETIYSIAKKYQTEAQNIINFPFNDYADQETFSLASGQIVYVPEGVIEAPKKGIPSSPRARQSIAAGQAGTGAFIWPTSGVITQYMSWYHPALDIANRASPPIIAADRGTVVVAGWSKAGYGNHIIVDHGNGYQTLYAHLSRLDVSVGQGVDRGGYMGVMGSTGRSTGTHLHFEIHQGGKKLNPLSLLR